MNLSKKQCTTCNLTKNITEFNKQASSKDGYKYVCRICSIKANKDYYSTKEKHMLSFLSSAKRRAKKNNIPFDLDVEFLLQITTDKCPIFKTPFVWGMGRGLLQFSPSLDKVIPELGYIKGNVVFISYIANTVKQNLTEKELYTIADWLHEKRKEVLKNVKPK